MVNTDLPTIAMGLYHIAATLKEHDIACHIHKFKDTTLLFETIKRYHVCVIGFSVHWHSQLISSIKLAEQVKCEFPDSVIVLGGLTASYFSRQLIAFDPVDFVVVGDGEIPLLKIVQGVPPTRIPNILWKEDQREIRFNDIHYETDIETLRNFVYETHDDFRDTRFILKMGKGCFFKCFHCGGRNQAYVGRGIDQPVYFEAEDITYIVEQNYRKLKFTHLYMAQDHFRDIGRITRGVTALPPELEKKFSINVSAWGLPPVNDLTALCRKVRKVCLELTFDTIDEVFLAESRGYRFDGPVINHILSYLDELFEIPNLEILLFFSYPHIQADKLLFPDYPTLGAFFEMEDRFRRQHLEGRFGLYNLLLSTDPGSLYGSDYSFEEYWSKLLATRSGLGSFCFHYQKHMAENEFTAHHLFMQILMKIFEHATNFIQCLYRIDYRSDIQVFYRELFLVFNEIYQKEIIRENHVIQSYVDGHSYLGYSCIRQESVGDSQLSNFIFRFLTRCMDNNIINPQFAIIRYLFPSETRLSGAAYASCRDTARKQAGTKPDYAGYPVGNFLADICRRTLNVNLTWAGALLGAGSAFSERKYEVLWGFFPYFSLKELKVVCREDDNAFKHLYTLSKEFSPAEGKVIEMTVLDLIRTNGRKDLETRLESMLAGKGADLENLPVNYAVSEQTHKLIPLTPEELFVLDHCNGLNRTEDIAERFTNAFALDLDIFHTVMSYFYLNSLVI